MNENFTKEERDKMNIDSTSLSYALLISNVSVLVIGVILILRACFNTSEGDFLDAGFDDNIDYHDEGKGEHQKESSSSKMEDDSITFEKIVEVDQEPKTKTKRKRKTPLKLDI